MNKENVVTQAKFSFSIVESQYIMSKILKMKLTLDVLFKETEVSSKGNSHKTTQKVLLGKENWFALR